MSTYLYWSGGNNSDGTLAGGWEAAKNTLAGAIALATVDGDVILFHKTSQENVAANTTITFLANVVMICVDKDNSNAPAVMGTDGWFGHNAASRSITLAGAKKVKIKGLTVRTASTYQVIVNSSDGGHFELEDFRHWSSSTITTAPIYLGNAGNSFIKAKRLTLDVDRASSNTYKAYLFGTVVLEEMNLDMASAPTAAVFSESPDFSSSNTVTIVDSDLSNTWESGVIASQSRVTGSWTLVRCKLPANAVLLQSQTLTNLSGHRVTAIDCSSGNTHGLFQHVDAFGSIVSDAGIYFSTGAAGQSWKITTTENCSHATPFVTPWISVYHTGTSAITPRFEILRDGNINAYQTDEIGAEFSAKVTSGSVVGTTYSDYMPLLGTPANQDVGTGTSFWDGDTGAWSGKIDSGTAFTPAENGEILGRALVGEPSITVYLDPQIRW